MATKAELEIEVEYLKGQLSEKEGELATANDWPSHPDADPDCECCLGDGLQADGETRRPCIDARKGYRAAQASPDQYHKEII